MAVAAHDGGLFAHADLTHVDAHVELARQVAHQLAKVHAVLGGKVAYGLLAVEDELDAHRLHLEARGGHQAAEGRHGVLGALGELLGALKVVIGGDPLDAAQLGVADGLS